MDICLWPDCNNLTSRINIESNILLNVHSCKFHTTCYCNLCNIRITTELSVDSDITYEYIKCHFMIQHTLRNSSRNYAYQSRDSIILVGSSCMNGYFGSGICNMSDVFKTNPHFIYLVPQFSISDMLDYFDEAYVSEWRLLAAIRNKPFSCLACGGIFESFPSNEVFNAHKCKS